MMTDWFSVILWKWPIIKKTNLNSLMGFSLLQLLSSLKFTLSHFCPVVASSSWFLCHFYMNSVGLFPTVEYLLCMYCTYYPLPPFFWLQYIYIVRVHGHMCIYYTVFFNIFMYFMFILSFNLHLVNLHLVLFLHLNIYVWKPRIPYKGHFSSTGQ